jgi:O-antigen/teichoic acid export membrane protein
MERTVPAPGRLLSRAGSTQSLLRQGAIVFAGSMALAICGFIFQMIASRKLGVETYGTFYALLSMTSIALLPGAILSPVVARYAAEFQALHDDSHVHGLALDLVRWTSIAAVGYAVLGLLLAIPIADFAHVPVWAVPVAAVIGAVGLNGNVLRAVAQGVQEFTALAFSTAAEGGAKVILLVLLLFAGLGLVGGLFGYLGGVLCGLAIIVALLTRRYAMTSVHRARYEWRRIGLSASGAAAVTIATTLIGTVDVILVKHYFSAHEAGLYSAAALGGKVLFFAVGFVPTVLLPRAADRSSRGSRTRDVLWTSVAIMFAVALLGGIALQLFGSLFLRVLVGPAYAAASVLLLPYALAMIALGLANLLAFYGIATHRLAFAVPLVAGTALTLVTVALLHSDAAEVVRVLLVGNTLTCVAVASALALQARRHLPVLAS